MIQEMKIWRGVRSRMVRKEMRKKLDNRLNGVDALSRMPKVCPPAPTVSLSHFERSRDGVGPIVFLFYIDPTCPYSESQLVILLLFPIALLKSFRVKVQTLASSEAECCRTQLYATCSGEFLFSILMFSLD